jgi:hypothetical protein
VFRAFCQWLAEDQVFGADLIVTADVEPLLPGYYPGNAARVVT